MKSKKAVMLLKLWVICSVSLVLMQCAYAQEHVDIDASKPTNFYSMLDNTIEISNRPTENIMGYRGKLMYAPSEAHLLLAEIPLLYNSRTDKFGLGDLRARYFYLPYKNYDSFFGAFGPSIDVFAPTANFENGLGSDQWLISPGITAGLMAADWIQFFPVVSYQYASTPLSDTALKAGVKEAHGVTFQSIIPIVLSADLFIQLTPIYQLNNLSDERYDRYIQELFVSYALLPKMQLTAYFNGNFKDDIHTVSLGLNIFLVD